MKVKAKLTNRSIWAIVIILWALVLLYLFVRQNYYGEEKIVEAFMQTPYNRVECKVEAFGELPGAYLVEEEREKLVKEIASMLGIKDPYTVDRTDGEEIQIVKLCKPAKNANTIITYQLKTPVNEQLEYEANQYVSVEITLSDSMESGMSYKDMLEHIYEIYGMESQVSVNFTGEIAGNRTLKERNILANEMIDRISGKVVREFRSDEMYTIYGYSRRLKEYEEIAGEKMNFNLAMTYDEEKDVTCIHLATPYMMEDY